VTPLTDADIQPADDYRLDMDDELIESLSGQAYRRVATYLHLPSTIASPMRHGVALGQPCGTRCGAGKRPNWQNLVGGGSLRTLRLTRPKGKTHDQTHLFSRTASQFRRASSNIPEAGRRL
jgi:transcriptional regulator of nitric oxide reductase